MPDIPLMHARERADLLDPRELAALGGLEFVARAVVEGFIAGLHRSPHRGFSVEFAEHRMYQPGDDLRYVDWRMFGRSDRYYIKQFEEETNLRCYLLLDTSASMGWTSGDGLPSKLWYAQQLAASLSLLLLRQGDAVGLVGFDDVTRVHIAPRGGLRHWHELLRALEHLGPAGRTEAGSALRDVTGRLRRRGLVVLISDLLVEQATTRLALQYLRHRGHEVVVFHLIDPGERELPPGIGDARFVDPETGEELPVSVVDLRREYRDAVQHAIEEWRSTLRPQGIDYEVVDTDAPLAHALRAYLHKRERLG